MRPRPVPRHVAARTPSRALLGRVPCAMMVRCARRALDRCASPARASVRAPSGCGRQGRTGVEGTATYKYRAVATRPYQREIPGFDPAKEWAGAARIKPKRRRWWDEKERRVQHFRAQKRANVYTNGSVKGEKSRDASGTYAEYAPRVLTCRIRMRYNRTSGVNHIRASGLQ